MNILVGVSLTILNLSDKPKIIPEFIGIRVVPWPIPEAALGDWRLFIPLFVVELEEGIARKKFMSFVHQSMLDSPQGSLLNAPPEPALFGIFTPERLGLK